MLRDWANQFRTHITYMSEYQRFFASMVSQKYYIPIQPVADVDKVRDPVTNKPLKLKNLVKIKFTPIDEKLSDAKRQAAKARWKVNESK